MFQEKLLNFLDFSGQILQILCTPPIKVCNIPHSYNAKKYNTDKNNLKDFVPLNDFSVCSACISNAKPNLTEASFSYFKFGRLKTAITNFFEHNQIFLTFWSQVS